MYPIYQKFSNLKLKPMGLLLFLALIILEKDHTKSVYAVNPVGQINPPQRVSLKGGGVIARTGPGKNYPQARVYLREQPVFTIAFFEHYRQIRDLWGFTSWVHKNSLGSQQIALTAKETALRKGPHQEEIAKLDPGVMVFIKSERGEGLDVEVFMTPHQGEWMNALESRATMAISKMKGWVPQEDLRL